MMIEPNEMEFFHTTVKNNNFRLTDQRLAVLHVLFTRRNEHLTVEEICGQARQFCPSLGIATVYKNLCFFEEAGIVQKIKLADHSSRYEMLGSDNDCGHSHMICTRCGKIMDLDEIPIEDERLRIEDQYRFAVTSRSIVYYGICGECRQTTEADRQA